MKRRRQREDLTPDLTPLMDVMFLLIIFFIVTSVFKKNEALLNLQLPTAEGTPKPGKAPKNVLLELTKDGFAINSKKTTLDEFTEYCKNISDPAIPVDLRIDKAVVYDRVVKVLSILQQYNLSNLSLITEFK
ncbi:MAG: biopolymer transporter ExbD [Epsilonproteobacteria bacterium]|nr:MAG: biopolymer transporter ExbD [Campylobacterota bacterium]RLA66782.1 MAG: biopolymer transporter ExbD [Campylobacterota bacterium]